MMILLNNTLKILLKIQGHHPMDSILKKRWKIANPIPDEVSSNLKKYPQLLSQLLYNRGIYTDQEADIYLNKSGSLFDPFLMIDMMPAIDRILHAINHQERIAVYGDYDVDGVTASVLLSQVLQSLGADVCEYIPNRFDEGYGLNKEAIDLLSGAGIQLILTVDCGIRSLEEVEHATLKYIDMIITDHHAPLENLPLCNAVVSPKREGDPYPEKNLAEIGRASCRERV